MYLCVFSFSLNYAFREFLKISFFAIFSSLCVSLSLSRFFVNLFTLSQKHLNRIQTKMEKFSNAGIISIDTLLLMENYKYFIAKTIEASLPFPTSALQISIKIQHQNKIKQFNMCAPFDSDKLPMFLASCGEIAPPSILHYANRFLKFLKSQQQTPMIAEQLTLYSVAVSRYEMTESDIKAYKNGQTLSLDSEEKLNVLFHDTEIANDDDVTTTPQKTKIISLEALNL
jgi:hypothetical protein